MGTIPARAASPMINQYILTPATNSMTAKMKKYTSALPRSCAVTRMSPNMRTKCTTICAIDVTELRFLYSFR